MYSTEMLTNSPMPQHWQTKFSRNKRTICCGNSLQFHVGCPLEGSILGCWSSAVFDARIWWWLNKEGHHKSSTSYFVLNCHLVPLLQPPNVAHLLKNISWNKSIPLEKEKMGWAGASYKHGFNFALLGGLSWCLGKRICFEKEINRKGTLQCVEMSDKVNLQDYVTLDDGTVSKSNEWTSRLIVKSQIAVTQTW